MGKRFINTVMYLATKEVGTLYNSMVIIVGGFLLHNYLHIDLRDYFTTIQNIFILGVTYQVIWGTLNEKHAHEERVEMTYNSNIAHFLTICAAMELIR